MSSRRRRLLHILAMALALGAPAAGGAADASPASDPARFRPAGGLLNLNVHIYGFSYHTDRQGVRRQGLDNEINGGLGLNYTIHENAQGIGFVEAGAYRDSGSNWAKLVGLGYQLKLGERWRLGGALAGIQSATYNRGRFFIAPLPMLTYDLGAFKLNAVYAPRYGDYNQFAVFGLYLSIPFRQ